MTLKITSKTTYEELVSILEELFIKRKKVSKLCFEANRQGMRLFDSILEDTSIEIVLSKPTNEFMAPRPEWIIYALPIGIVVKISYNYRLNTRNGSTVKYLKDF